jgi:hypothetical protein
MSVSKGGDQELINNHFTLYQGYVTNTNKLLDTLATMLKEGRVEAPRLYRGLLQKHQLGRG